MVPLEAPRTCHTFTACPLPTTMPWTSSSAARGASTRPAAFVSGLPMTAWIRGLHAAAPHPAATCRTLPAPLPVLLAPSPTSGWLWSKGSLGSSPSYQPCTATVSMESVRFDRPVQLGTPFPTRIPFPCVAVVVCLRSQAFPDIMVCLRGMPFGLSPAAMRAASVSPVHRHTCLTVLQPRAREPTAHSQRVPRGECP